MDKRQNEIKGKEAKMKIQMEFQSGQVQSTSIGATSDLHGESD